MGTGIIMVIRGNIGGGLYDVVSQPALGLLRRPSSVIKLITSSEVSR
jgi:hypothetical protein